VRKQAKMVGDERVRRHPTWIHRMYLWIASGLTLMQNSSVAFFAALRTAW
jgi:hypothetical protein